MLYDFDTACLANALTPSKAKLESKGVKSVPMRVTCLKNEGITLTPVEFERFMIESITDGEPYVLTAEDVAEVEKIEQGYYDPAFMRISANKTSETAKGKRHVSNNSIIKGLGEFCVEFDIDRPEATSATCPYQATFSCTEMSTKPYAAVLKERNAQPTPSCTSFKG